MRRWGPPPRAAAFTVTLLPDGVGSKAKPEDFRRVSVRALNALAARSAEAVLAQRSQGFYVCEVVEAGYESLEIAMALNRARAAAAGEPPADLRGANSATPSGPYLPTPRAG